MIFADSETPAIQRAKLAQRPVCVQWAVDDGPVQLQLWRDVPIRELLANTIVGANIAYDMACFIEADRELIPLVFAAYDEGRVIDVQLDAKLLDIAAGEYDHRSIAGWNLQELARRVGIRIEKDADDATGDGSWRLRFAALDGIPIESWPAGAVTYATEEIPATRAVYRAQQQARAAWQAQGLDPLGYHSAHAAASAFALHLIQCQGVLTDPVAVEHVAQRINGYLDSIRGRLIRAGLVRKDGSRNTHAVQRAMVKACAKVGRDIEYTAGAENKEREALEKLAAARARASEELQTRGPKARVAILRRPEEIASKWHGGVHLPGVKIDHDQCILSGSRVLDLYGEYSVSLLLARVERLRQGCTLPIQARFDPLKETSRTSCTLPQDPLIGDQLQNHPRSNGFSADEKKRERDDGEYFTGLRECFRPRPGHMFLISDFSMAELHTVAQLCVKLFGFSKLAELLNAGIDVHWWLAAVTLGKTYEEILNVKQYKKDRQRVKPGNFGFWGGMGADKFVLYSRKGYGIRFTVPEAKAFKLQWRNALPETGPYFDWIDRQLGDRDGNEHASFTHVHPITGYVRGGCGYTDGANHGFQHLAAYGAKLALYSVTRACFNPRSPLFGSRPWNFVHDEIVTEAPCAMAHEAAREQEKIMTETFNQFVPDVPTRAETIVSSVWSKHAKRIEGGVWHPPMAVAA